MDDSLILGSKTLRDKPSKKIMGQPKGMATASGGGVSSTEPAGSKVRAMQSKVVGVRRVTVKVNAMQQVVDIAVRATEKTDGFMDALINRGRNIATSSRNGDM